MKYIIAFCFPHLCAYLFGCFVMWDFNWLNFSEWAAPSRAFFAGLFICLSGLGMMGVWILLERKQGGE